MSLFETLKKAIFHNPLAQQGASHSSPAGVQPANTVRPGVAQGPTANTASPAPSSATAPRPAAPQATPAVTAPASVDIERVLEGLNAKSAQKLNWRTSIVDLMKLVGMDSSLQNRKTLATELGYSGDANDSAAMNIWLHKAVMKKLAENGGKLPAGLH